METFAIAPATAKTFWMLPAVLVPLVLIVAIISIGAIRGARKTHFDVTPEGLRIAGGFYSRVIPSSELRAGDARRVDFGADSGLKPSWRTNGIGLPGYQAGWFRLSNSERAFAQMTDRTKAVYVPTSGGYSVIVTPADPDAFVAALRRAGPR